MPNRVVLSRKKGWRKPEGAVIVARPTKWGNPFDWRDYVDAPGRAPLDPLEARRLAIEDFGRMVRSRGSERSRYPSDEEIVAELGGRDLACWCSLDGPCHVDVLLEIANGPGGRIPQS
jgi:hypothetical protein